MKVKYFIGLTAIALLSSCTNEDGLLNDSFGKDVVSASIEGMNSRVGFEYENRTGQFFWSAGDAIGVYYGSGFYEYTLQGVGGESTGNFKAKNDVISGTSKLCALYPYNEQHSVSNGKVNFYMSTEYIYTNDDTEFGSVDGNPTNVPMLAKIATEGSTNYTFGHLGGALCFKFIGVPANASKFVFTANSKITGAFEVDAAASDPKITTSESTTDNAVEINFTAKNEATTRVFYIPMPNGTYTGFSWKFLDSSSTELKSYITTTATNTITDGKLLTITYTLDASGTGNISSTASNLTELKNALASGDDNIQLTANIELTEDLNVSDDTTIDLNGQSLNTSTKSITVSEGKTLNLTNNSAVGASRSAAIGIMGTSDIIVASPNSTINIGEGVNLTTTGANSCCIFIPGSSDPIANGVTVNSAGNLLATQAGSATIYVNGKVTSGTINITGGSVKHNNDVAIYIAGKADLNISGGAIEGTTGVEIRAGKLNITGGTITATAQEFTATANNNGSTSVGAAVAVAQHITNHELNATISAGSFNGAMALYEEDTCDDNVSNISLSVTGGTFNGKISSENCKNFIIGGTFSDASAFDYLGDNANVILGADMTLTKTITFRSKAVLNLNNHNINIEEANKDAIWVLTGGNLTINGEGSVISKSYYSVYAGGDANVTINGGNYEGLGAAIYAQSSAIVEINDGTFKADNNDPEYAPQDFTLNLKDGTAAQFIVKGGKYYKFNPAASKGENPVANFVASGYSSVANGDYYEVKKGIYNEAALKGAIVNGAEIILDADVEITDAITIADGKNVTINLNGKTIENKTAGHPSMITPNIDDECVVFMVTDGTLTINGKGNVKATGDGEKSDYNVAVWVMGESAEAIINGGNYINSTDTKGDGCDLIYGRNGAKIEINGGSFQSYIRSSLGGGSGTYDVLDCRDYKEGSFAQSTITVNGGKFKNYVPSYENVGANEVVLGTNKAVYNGETIVAAKHDITGADVWYEVK